MSITELLTELKAAYGKAGLDCGDGLHPPASEQSIERLETRLAMPIPEELRDVLRVHGGQDYISPGITGLFGSHKLLSPDEIVEDHKMYQTHCCWDPLPDFPPKAGDSGYWVPALIPFASWDAYHLCIHSLRGDVWEFSPNLGLWEHRPNIRSVLRELLDAVQAGREPSLHSTDDDPQQ